MEAARAIVEQLAGGPPAYGVSTGVGALATVTIPPERRGAPAAYGVSTGFGALATVTIPRERRAALQTALVRSHAAGIGEPVEREVVRAMMFLRARTLALGCSGNRPLVADALLALLNN